MEILNCAYCGTVYSLEHLGHTIYQTENHDLICLACSDAQRDIADECNDMSDVEADADVLRMVGMGTDEDYGYYGEYGPFGDY